MKFTNVCNGFYNGDNGEIFHDNKKITEFKKCEFTEFITFDKPGTCSEWKRSEAKDFRVVVKLEEVIINKKILELLGLEKTPYNYKLINPNKKTLFKIKCLAQPISGNYVNSVEKNATISNVAFILEGIPKLFQNILSLNGTGSLVEYSNIKNK